MKRDPVFQPPGGLLRGSLEALIYGLTNNTALQMVQWSRIACGEQAASLDAFLSINMYNMYHMYHAKAQLRSAGEKTTAVPAGRCRTYTYRYCEIMALISPSIQQPFSTYSL